MNYLDLFSGIGGFALGAYRAGWRFQRHYFSEIDPWCCRLYQQRFPDAVPLGDIREIDGLALLDDAKHRRRDSEERIAQAIADRNKSEDGLSRTSSYGGWLITGGFPCQDISVAGKGAGITGERSGLWFEYARLIGQIRPRYAIMENVGALTRRGLDRVLGSLAEIGYDAEWSDIRASDVGAPHRRERIWIVAYPQHSEAARQRKHGGKRLSVAAPVRPGEGSEQISNAGWTTASRYGRGVREIRQSDWWATEPDVGRVAHGIPARVDRLRGLGNAIVPQIAELIFLQLAHNLRGCPT